MKKEMWIFIIVLFMCIGAVLGIFCYNKSNEYEYSFKLPLTVESITIEQNEIEATIEDSNKINDIINILSGTGRKPIAESIQDFPTNVENVISVHYNCEEIFTFYVYEKNNEYFIERAYNGIYRISPNEYYSIEKYITATEKLSSGESTNPNEGNLSDVITDGTSVNEIFERKMPDELKISTLKPCDERFIYLLTQDKSSYIYDYKEDTYKLVLANENIEHINFLNVLKNKNKIYLEVQYKNGKFSLLGINYLDGTFSEIELTIIGADIKVSEDEKKITYRKESSSLYVSDIDGSNEKLLLKSINKGENPDTTGYVPNEFIENNKILYTCIGYEDTKGLRNYKF